MCGVCDLCGMMARASAFSTRANDRSAAQFAYCFGRSCDVRQSRIAFIEPGHVGRQHQPGAEPRQPHGQPWPRQGCTSRRTRQCKHDRGAGELRRASGRDRQGSSGICLGDAESSITARTLDIGGDQGQLPRRAKLCSIKRGLRETERRRTSAAIFWLKVASGRWREKDVHEVTGLNGGPIQMVDVSGLSDAQLSKRFEPVLSSLAVSERRSMMDAHHEDGLACGSRRAACSPPA